MPVLGGRAPMQRLGIVIFAQAESTRVDLVKILGNARQFFEAEVEVLDERLEDREQARVGLRLASKKHGYAGTFVLVSRPANESDRLEAVAAEARGRATNMSLLAAKCAFVWEVRPEPDTPEAATLNLCGVLASVALGPVMPADRSTLYGVRGSMERLEKLLA